VIFKKKREKNFYLHCVPKLKSCQKKVVGESAFGFQGKQLPFLSFGHHSNSNGHNCFVLN
jgi:hypothetical protein